MAPGSGSVQRPARRPASSPSRYCITAPVRRWTAGAAILKRVRPPDGNPCIEVRLYASFAATTDNSASVRGLIAVVTATLCYSSITTLSRLAYDDGATPLTVIALCSAVFVLAIGSYLAFARGGIDLPRRAWYASLVFALFMAVWAYGYLASVAYIPVSLAALLFFTFPLLVGLFAAIAGQERMTILKAVALLLAFAGLTLALGPSWDTLDWRGVALVLTASAVCALAFIFITPIFREYDLLAVSFLTHVWIVLGALAYGLVVNDFALPRSIDGQFLVMATIVCYIGAYSFWALAIPLIGSVRTAGMMNLEPVISISLAALILGERLTPIQLGGSALVLLALVLVARTPQPRRAFGGGA